MSDWNPALYRRYEDQRTRPAHELLARVPLISPARVVDLGCGPGNSTELLRQRFPDAELLGIDSSDAMLASARKRLPQIAFAAGDIGSWTPEQPPDLIYANAALQWVPVHEALVPRLFAALAPGGVLAIQMPDNQQEPTHRLMRELAGRPPWAEIIGDAGRARAELLSVGGYYDLLASQAAELEIWHTTYQHPMESAAAIVEWVRSTGLRPFVDPLPPALAASYLAEYESRVAAAYPRRGDGRRLLAYPRLFIVARRKS
ncbi:MAG: Trans-aconitate 2-methyltransferase [Burkholderiaceae bacterium]|jgi:trans-aconitate 2-methyltransferase|nr:MAG: Trans-aconitate 2-methyltransferase [Burkholderiaceae bacterium]